MKNLKKKRQVPFLFLSFFCGTKNLLLFLRDSRIGIQVLICGLRQCFPTRFGRPLPPIIKQSDCLGSTGLRHSFSRLDAPASEAG